VCLCVVRSLEAPTPRFAAFRNSMASPRTGDVSGPAMTRHDIRHDIRDVSGRGRDRRDFKFRDTDTGTSPNENTAVVFVGGLHFSTDDSTLRSFCEAFGDVMSVKIIHDHDTQRSRGFGFVTFANADEARRAVQQMDGRVVDGRNLRCNLAPDKERDRRDTSFVSSFSGRGRHAVDDEADTRKHGSGRVGWDRDEHDRRQRCASKNDDPENDENRKRRKKTQSGRLVSDAEFGDATGEAGVAGGHGSYAHLRRTEDPGGGKNCDREYDANAFLNESASTSDSGSDGDGDADRKYRRKREKKTHPRVVALELLLRKATDEVRFQRLKADAAEGKLAKMVLQLCEFRDQTTRTLNEVIVAGDRSNAEWQE
jgi:hypothetical protein